MDWGQEPCFVRSPYQHLKPELKQICFYADKGLSDERHGIVDKETVSLRQIGRDVRDLLDTNIRSEEIQTLKKESSRIRTAVCPDEWIVFGRD